MLGVLAPEGSRRPMLPTAWVIWLVADVDVHAAVELDDDPADPRHAGPVDLADPGDALEGLLDGGGDVLLDGLAVGARIAGGNGHGGEVDLGQLGDREPEGGHDAEEGHGGEDHGDEDRPPDGDAGDRAHRVLIGALPK